MKVYVVMSVSMDWGDFPVIEAIFSTKEKAAAHCNKYQEVEEHIVDPEPPKKSHECIDNTSCICGPTTLEPKSGCPVHEPSFPKHCKICGQYMKRNKK
jgi:hypothetical protein